MQPHTTKQDAIEAIQRLPDNANLEDIMYRLYVLENIKRGQDDIAQGKLTTTDDLLQEIKTW
jgi:predicted transcriptional regulator